MDRVTVYPAEIPLTEDVLDGQRNAYIAVGHLAQLALGSQMAAAGFSVSSSGLQLSVSPGAVYNMGEVDAEAYGELAADTSPLMQQFLSPGVTSLTAPASSTSYIYATTSVIDADPVVLPFYNAADPSQTFSGPDNSGSALPTRRRNVATVAIGTTIPSGAVPLWQVVATDTAVTVTAAPAAPFYTTLAQASLRICAPFDPVLAAAAGGYPKGIVLPDSTTAGAFWVSTAANNTTVPGASGASWVSLFNGLAVLDGGNTFTGTQNITGALNVTGTITALLASSTQKVTLRRGSGFAGINSYDGTNWHYLYIDDDDTATTAKGTLAFSNAAQTFTETQTFSGEVLVPDATDPKNPVTLEQLEALLDLTAPVGTLQAWPAAVPPDGWIAYDGSTFSLTQYPKLAAVFPTGVLPDPRGLIIRGYDPLGLNDPDGATRGILSYQEGSILLYPDSVNPATPSTVQPGNGNNTPEALGIEPTKTTMAIGWRSAVPNASGTMNSDASTGCGATRPKNMNFNYIVRAA